MELKLRHVTAPLLLCAFSSLGNATPAQAASELIDMALDAPPGGTQVTLSLSAPVAQHVFTLSRPTRVVIDLPQTRLLSSLHVPVAAGSIVRVRAGMRPNRMLRVVLELSSARTPVVAARRTAGVYRLRIALADAARSVAATTASGTVEAPTAPPASIASTAPAALNQPNEVAAAPEVVHAVHAPPLADRDIVVAIDAGHGGEDPGATGANGTHEKDVVLAIARSLAARINRASGMRAVLTRDGDYFIPLRERIERARAARADMFVSIHADAVRDREVSGASVYILSDRGASNEAARLLAENENAADLKGGVSLANRGQLASVLLDLSQSANIGASVEAADSVLGALDGVGAVRKRQVQQAGFVVLKSPDIPSMLVETAYISNPAEERKLRADVGQQRLAGAIFSGVEEYFRKYPPEGTQFARRRERGIGSPVNVASN